MAAEREAAEAAALDDHAAPAEQVTVDAVGADDQLTVEDLLDMIERLTGERDAHFDARARLQAEFDNYRKRVASQQAEQVERAAESLVGRLLPVLDAFEAAQAHGVEGIDALAGQLLGVLEKEGLDRIAAEGEAFDPEFHEAVMHEAGEGPTVVADVLRTGYRWKGRVLRPAMVKVRG